MEDLKKYLVIDNNQLFRSLSNIDRLGKLSFISSEFDYWKDLFTYSEEKNHLENFLLFRTASALGLYKEEFNDPDLTPPALNYLKDKLYKIKDVKKVIIGKDIEKSEKARTFSVTLNNGKKIYLESDTANSLMGDLRSFLIYIICKYKRLNNRNWYKETYMKKYGLSKSDEALRNYFWYTFISKLPDLLKEDAEKDCYSLLMQRAGLTHTIKNVILVPYGYNAKRGSTLKVYNSNKKINDRLDLTIEDLNLMATDEYFTEKQFHKRLNNNKCSIDSVKFLLKNKENLFFGIPNYPQNITEKGNKIAWISEVSKEINNLLDDSY